MNKIIKSSVFFFAILVLLISIMVAFSLITKLNKSDYKEGGLCTEFTNIEVTNKYVINEGGFWFSNTTYVLEVIADYGKDTFTVTKSTYLKVFEGDHLNYCINGDYFYIA